HQIVVETTINTMINEEYQVVAKKAVIAGEAVVTEDAVVTGELLLLTIKIKLPWN
ncbi:13471_t:CDS:1, partial [Acaulospora morrowiae]